RGPGQPGPDREQRRLPGTAPPDDPNASPRRDDHIEAVEDALAAERADEAVRNDADAAFAERRGIQFRYRLRQSAPFAGMTRIRFDGYALGSALSAPRVGAPRSAKLSSDLSRRAGAASSPLGNQSRNGSDGTRTRDLRRDRPARRHRLQPAKTPSYRLEQAFPRRAKRL